jgi:hypothetical protein
MLMMAYNTWMTLRSSETSNSIIPALAPVHV